MSFGQSYARAYDAFYRSKDYPAEARFVNQRLSKLLRDRKLNILDIGCGTGLHDVELVRAGHTVTGVDTSTEMLAHAQARRAALPAELQERLQFLPGDASNVRVGKTYDAVISLFHVMSYMAKDDAFPAALNTARAHLGPGGALLFDFWYGPAVIAAPPQRREREVEEGGKKIRRITAPFWDKTQNTVRIAFEVLETDVATGQSNASSEEHVMRYFFTSDLERALPASGFEIVEICEWLTGAAPGENSFGVYVLARAI